MGNEQHLKEGKICCNPFTTSHGNMVWAAAMQLAWNQLRQKFVSDHPIHLKTENAQSLEMINKFNGKQFTRKDIDEKSIYIKSGYGQQTLNTINEEVKKKFPNKTISPIEGPLNDDDIISYAYLFKQILFEVKFQRRQELSLKFNGKTVKSFHSTNANQNKQILVHYYIDAFKFMVEIRGKNQKDSLLLIKDSSIKSVQQALAASVVKSNKSPLPLKKRDIFQMPVVKLNLQREYKELVGLPFENNELKQYMIRKMTQVIKLSIDESGAKVENQAVIIASRCFAFQEEEQKMIILDESFWIVMKEEDKNPYLCVLINTPEEGDL